MKKEVSDWIDNCAICIGLIALIAAIVLFFMGNISAALGALLVTAICICTVKYLTD